MTLLLFAVVLWLVANAFVLSLCRAAKNGDRGLQRGMAAERHRVSGAGAGRRERVAVGS